MLHTLKTCLLAINPESCKTAYTLIQQIYKDCVCHRFHHLTAYSQVMKTKSPKQESTTAKRSNYKASYGQIKYLMKRLNTALSAKLRDGRPRKYCKRCSKELLAAKRPQNIKKSKLQQSSPVTSQNTSVAQTPSVESTPAI